MTVNNDVKISEKLRSKVTEILAHRTSKGNEKNHKMTSDMTAEGLNQKHSEYEAWGLSVRGNMEKMIIFIAYQVLALYFSVLYTRKNKLLVNDWKLTSLEYKLSLREE
jgi:hypothetical protein